MALAGVNHITISPWLLTELAGNLASGNETVSLFDKAPEEFETQELIRLVGDEEGFKDALLLSGDGEGERKLREVCVVRRDRRGQRPD